MLPLLEIDGMELTQSSAIVKYLAKRGHLYGDNPQEEALCDVIFGAIGDFEGGSAIWDHPTATPGVRIGVLMFPFQADPEAACRDLEDVVGKFCPRFEGILESNNSDSGGAVDTLHLVGTRLSYVDILLASAVEAYVERLGHGFLEPYPRLAQLHSQVLQLPRIRDYLTSPARFGVPDENYVENVARVLRRPLPPHLPGDSERFVRYRYDESKL